MGIWSDYLARYDAIYAELFKKTKDLTKITRNLRQARDILKECGAGGWVKKCEKELAELL
jgi:hypothetical protein